MDSSDIAILTRMAEELQIARNAVNRGLLVGFENSTASLRSLCRGLEDNLLRIVMGNVVQLLDVIEIQGEED